MTRYIFSIFATSVVCLTKIARIFNVEHRAILLLLSCLLCASCGQKGDLKRPETMQYSPHSLSISTTKPAVTLPKETQ